MRGLQETNASRVCGARSQGAGSRRMRRLSVLFMQRKSPGRLRDYFDGDGFVSCGLIGGFGRTCATQMLPTQRCPSVQAGLQRSTPGV